MYAAKKFDSIDFIGPAFEELSSEEMYYSDGKATPTIVLIFAGKLLLSACASAAVSASCVLAFE